MARLPRFGFGPRAPVEAAAEQVATAPQGYKPSFMEMFDAVASGQTITDARKGLMAEHQAAQEQATQRQQMAALMDQVLTDPRERLAFMANKPEWAKSVATNVGASNVPGGATRLMPGFGKFSAPEILTEGDSIISATPGEGMQVLGKRDPSFKEQNEVDIKERLADIREMLGGAQAARMRAQTEQGNARIGIARQKANSGGARQPSRGLSSGRVLGSKLPEGY